MSIRIAQWSEIIIVLLSCITEQILSSRSRLGVRVHSPRTCCIPQPQLHCFTADNYCCTIVVKDGGNIFTRKVVRSIAAWPKC